MLPRQTSLSFSVYSDLYDKLIPRDNKLRQLNDLVDFTFVYDELSSRYCQTNGRVAIDPVRVFKYLLLKVIFDLSDVDVVDRSHYDLSFKYFLGLAPEDDVLDASTLTRFRRQRLKDMNLLDLLVSKTVSLARSSGVLEGKAIILDATHTLSRYNLYSARVALQGVSVTFNPRSGRPLSRPGKSTIFSRRFPPGKRWSKPGRLARVWYNGFVPTGDCLPFRW
ncbi:transposase [Butyricimonas sp.]